MSLDLNSFEGALKQHYGSDAVQNMTYMDNPWLALVPKMEDFTGESWKVPLIISNSANRSQDFSQANSLDTAVGTTAFLVTRVHDYSFANLDNETMEASRGSGAFMEAASVAIDGAINALTRSLAIKLYRDGFGSIGQINATVTGTTLTLTNPNDITNYEIGQVLQFASTSGSSVLRNTGSSVTVVAVNRSAGSMTVSGDLSTVTGLASGDFIFQKGDRVNSASPPRVVISGLEAWIPATAPSATLFFGVDRTIDVTRLAGLRLDITTMPIDEALIEGANQVGREGGKIDHYLMSYASFSALEKALGSKVQYVDVKMNAEVGFRGMMVNGPRGPIKVIPDMNCPTNRIFGIELKSWKLGSLKKAIRIQDSDGNKWLRQNGADGNQVRCVYYANLVCFAPGHNINLFSTNIAIA